MSQQSLLELCCNRVFHVATEKAGQARQAELGAGTTLRRDRVGHARQRCSVAIDFI